MTNKNNWSIERAKEHYRISKWSNGYFDINCSGHVVTKVAGKELDLYTLIQEFKNRGMKLPILARFPQILQQSLSDICEAFENAIRKHDYSGKYIPAYPIKVNQQSSVIQHFQQQTQCPVAFEVGTKAELIACLGIIDKRHTIICNGYKDETYMRLALMGGLLGHEIIIVLESLDELSCILSECSKLDVHANLGMRVRLSSIAKGNWQNTGGEHSKFGLTSTEVLRLVSKLDKHNALPWMKMLHFHMGSQIPNLSNIRAGVKEGMHYLAELRKYAIEFDYLNIGGGLAVDYQGSRNEDYFSMNYDNNEYAETVVGIVNSICKEKSLKPPTIYTENGRAMTAYHAVLLVDVINVKYQNSGTQDELTAVLHFAETNTKLSSLAKIFKLVEDDQVSTTEQHYDRLKATLDEIEQSFSQGQLSLEEKTNADRLASFSYQKLLAYPSTIKESLKQILEDKQVAKYFCNFSLFQSTPDIWGLQQIFPIMPLHQLQNCPETKARVYDLTCDSDGRVDKYVEADAIKPYLSLHKIHDSKQYVLGFFLVGAYQEILGDMHNLFGDTNAANIEINLDGSYQICDEEPGDTIAEILSYLHLDTNGMRKHWLEKLSHTNVAGQLKEFVMEELDSSLNANSYLG